MRALPLLVGSVVVLLSGCVGGPPAASDAPYDVVIRGGTIYDGSGHPPFIGDVAIRGDTIAAVGNLKNVSARREVDARGLAVAPGFINMLSWATPIGRLAPPNSRGCDSSSARRWRRARWAWLPR